jgi:peptidoglycan/LPS O-acetylase OafA/YrhL
MTTLGSTAATASSHKSQAYRPDIDGLRAIAVLAVLGFHAFPAHVGGGFVGVDVFFVISGFLISGILMKALDRGSFSFREFYSRRIRRIFPALIVVLVACYVVGWFLLLPG